MNGRIFIVGIVLLFHIQLCGQSNNEQYKFTRLDVNQGLSHNQINCFLRDRKGFLWAGTSSGLNRFDGYNFTVYRNSSQDSTSLVDNSINKLFEDPDGRIWVNTYFGVCVYNPHLNNFDRNSNRMLREYGIPEGIISDIIPDRNGNYWFIHQSSGLYRYDTLKKESVRVRYSENDIVSSMVVDSTNTIWIIYRSGKIEALDGKTFEVTYTSQDLLRPHTSEFLDYNLRLDNDNDLWVYVTNSNFGLFYFNTKTRNVVHINRRAPGLRLNSDIVRNVVVSKNGLIWVGTDHGGVNLIDKKNWTVKHILNDPGDDRSLSQNSINALYIDYEDIVWIGTFKKGINYYHNIITKFKLYRQQLNNPNSLPYDDVNSFAEDDKGNIWIGTNGGGLIYFDRQSNTFKRYVHEPGNLNSLSTNVIVSLLTDHEGKLWIGTYYGGLDSFDGKQFTHHKYNPTDPTSISDDNVWDIMEDHNHNLWIGTLVGGLNLFNRETKKFKRFTVADGIHTGYVPALFEDDEENIWVGTGYGISWKKKNDSTFTHILAANAPGALSNNGVIAVHQDTRGLLWLGTQDGLNVYDKKSKRFKSFRVEDGLPHNSIVSILEDDKHNLWVGTPNGISNILLEPGQDLDQLTPVFRNYDELDGLQGKQFNSRSALKTSKGELLFGGTNGFNLFKPDDLIYNEHKPPVVILDFQIFNNSVKVGEKIDGEIILNKSIGETESVTLKHNENVFSIEFAALSYFHPIKSQYKYKLEGFNKEWLTADGKSRKVTYTNLDPGEYTFRVIASNNDGFWNEEGTSLKINVLPPFWKTKIAFGIYLFVILGALFLTRQVILQRERMKFKIHQEREEAHRIHELDMLKIRFFTNVSHEFRTPLTLILTPLEKMLKTSNDVNDKNHLQLIYRNARRLLNLVNQLLDFRKMEVQEIKLTPTAGDIIHFSRDVAYSFSDLSEKKNISFSFQSAIDKLETVFDHNKLERILFNLISNAFKFTPEGGKVSVDLLTVERDGQQWLQIKVRDTGIGIPPDKKDQIFERFFQNDTPSSMVNQGSGIGLSITKEFVRLHGGTISVDSEPDHETCFTVELPVNEISAASPPLSLQVKEDEYDPSSLVSIDGPQLVKGTRRKPVLLLVEDNEDFRFYLKDNLRMRYQIVEAHNGKEGWSQAISHIPDLIVSDVMMPEMNGIDFCRKVRMDARTSHIPVILLTARSADDQIKQGFESGADDYVTKPFSFEILQVRLKNILERRAVFQKSFEKKVEIKASEIKISSLDEKLIAKAIKYVEEKISDPDFSVEDLSHEVGMSRVHLYKKLISLTGKSPIEFIRTIRLQHAAQLLEKSQLTVAEVAYKVGFNNPKYFAKYFKEQFNILPSLYAASKKFDKQDI